MFYMTMLIPLQAGALKQEGPLPTVSNAVKISTAVSNTDDLSQAKENEPPELLTNEIIVDEGKRHECPVHSVCLSDI